MSYRLAFAALTAVLFLPLGALAEVDLELAAKAAVKSSISPEGDEDTYRFEASRDSTASVTVKGKKGLDPEVTIVGPGDAPVSLAGATKFVDQGKKVLVKGLTLPAHGDYVLVVSGVGSGDYTLKLKVTPRKAVTETLALAGLQTGQFVVPVPDGATVVFTARAARNGAAVPEFPLDGKAANATHTVEDVEGPTDIGVDVHNANTDAGDVDVSAKIKAPRVKKQKLDVRDKTLAARGGGAAVGANVEAAGGGLVAVGEGELAGAGVAVPPGALDSDTYITVSSTSNVDVPDGGNTPAGPTVEFGPAGLSFSSPATVTVPYDPNAIPEGENAGDVLQVVQEESDGSQSTVDPVSVDVDAGTVSVETSGFSRFRAFVPRGRPRLSGGEFWLVDLGIELEPDGGNLGDSRTRNAFMGVGAVVLGDEGVTDASTVTARDQNVDFGHDGTAQGFVGTSVESFSTKALTWEYATDGRSITVDDSGGEDPTSLFVSEDGRFLTMAETGDHGVHLGLLGRKPSSQVTLADLAGDFWVGVFAFSAEQNAGTVLDLETWRVFGSVAVESTGSVRLVGDERSRGFFGGLETDRDHFSVSANVAVDGGAGTLQGSVLLTIPGETTFRLLPIAGGDVLFGLPEVVGSKPELMILVRKSTNASRATPAGVRSNGALFIDDVVTYDVLDAGGVTTHTLPDFTLTSISERVTVGTDGTADPFDTTETVLFRDAGEPSGVRQVVTTPDEPAGRISVDRKGKLTSNAGDDPIVGAVSPDGVFVFAVEAIGHQGVFGFDVSLRLPPDTSP